ncbi:MAG: sensor histidine kinase [Fidelibacterota bacterium]
MRKSLDKLTYLVDRFSEMLGQFQDRDLALKKELAERRRAEERLKQSRDQLRELSAHLQTVREEERIEIAREIHDELGQALTALKMDLFSLNRELPGGNTSFFRKMKSMLEVIDRSLGAVKRISTELRPGLLDDLGLSAAIEWQAREFQNRTGIDCQVMIGQDMIENPDQSTAIFRIVQEALTNVARHANAKKVSINLMKNCDKLVLEVLDDGRGISPGEISSADSFGIIGMRERVYPWGGKFEIKGEEGGGTSVTVTVPLDR